MLVSPALAAPLPRQHLRRVPLCRAAAATDTPGADIPTGAATTHNLLLGRSTGARGMGGACAQAPVAIGVLVLEETHVLPALAAVAVGAAPSLPRLA
jgi:hypothetical protein